MAPRPRGLISTHANEAIRNTTQARAARTRSAGASNWSIASIASAPAKPSAIVKLACKFDHTGNKRSSHHGGGRRDSPDATRVPTHTAVNGQTNTCGLPRKCSFISARHNRPAGIACTGCIRSARKRNMYPAVNANIALMSNWIPRQPAACQTANMTTSDSHSCAVQGIPGAECENTSRTGIARCATIQRPTATCQ